VKKLTFVEQLPLFNQIHDNKYEYDESTYIKTSVRMRIICKIHGEFCISPETHKLGKGCPTCKNIKMSKLKTLPFEQQLIDFNKTHKDRYQYDELTYVNNSTKMRMICKEHGEFWQSPNNHKNGRNCPKCSLQTGTDKTRFSFNRQVEDFNKIHNYFYKYIENSYVDNSTKMIIVCPIHGEFLQKPSKHKQGHGCPKCNNSNGEIKIFDYLRINNMIYEAQKRFVNCIYKKPLPFDFYLPELNICVEFDGEQHFKFVKRWHKTQEGFKIQQLKDKIKNDYCEKNNIKLIRIPYTEFDNIEELLDNELNIKTKIFYINDLF